MDRINIINNETKSEYFTTINLTECNCIDCASCLGCLIFAPAVGFFLAPGVAVALTSQRNVN